MSSDPRLSLRGRRVMVTRPPGLVAEQKQALAALGAEVVVCPLVRAEALPGAELPDLEDFDWLVVTSPGAVGQLRARLVAQTGGACLPAALRLAVVGPGTTAAAVAEFGRTPQLQPTVATGADLAQALRELGLPPGTRVLRVRGDLASNEVEQALGEVGARVEICTLYRTVAVSPGRDAVDLVARGEVAAVVFASGSAVASFEKGFPGHGLHGGTAAACLGPVTARAARRHGWRTVVTAPEPTAQSLAEALAAKLGPAG